MYIKLHVKISFEFPEFYHINLQVHQETFGKSGCRRIVPGQYLAVDPKGRAIMIGILIKLFSMKGFVYHLSHDCHLHIDHIILAV